MFNSLHNTLGTLLERMRLKSYEMKQIAGKKSPLTIIPANFTGLNSNAVLDGDLSSNIMDMTNRLEELDGKRNALGLRVICGPASLPFLTMVEARGFHATAKKKECRGFKKRACIQEFQRAQCSDIAKATTSRKNAAIFRKPFRDGSLRKSPRIDPRASCSGTPKSMQQHDPGNSNFKLFEE
ncbi:hypothetical protein Pint_03646 [Pistacia integerrima]|uniref:Uncharacterized protein n=1 Tax=Pistacia integerrima TaxID=434235 RepID=A0ACC0Z5A8_9ROSI|nr:hypothetical protein Pint_03646 [Pistacia integerrima]